jgi:dolichol-phosphate mannosyltransferase
VTDAVNPQDGPAEGYPGVGRVLVVIPTYNEAENVRVIVERVRTAVPSVDILIADDGSPDGTGAIADELAAADPQVHVLHRTRKEGLGAAYVAGFGWARDHDYDAVVEMDADGSHAPEQLSDLLDALRDADAVLGSRYVPGGKVVNWPMNRQLISRTGNLYVRMVLGMPSATPPAATAPTGCRSSTRSRSTRCCRRATASRSTSPGGRTSPAAGWSRCRSPSPSGSAARAR